MKKFMYFAAALLVLVGCNNKENVIENTPQNLVTITGGIDFSAQDGPNKVAAKEGWEDVTSGNKVGFVWEEGDKIAVVDYEVTEIKQFTVTSISEDKQKATFTGEPLSGGMESYLVLYPYEYGESIVHGTQYEFFANQQYTGKLRPAFMAMGSGDSFNVFTHYDVFDLSLKGSVKLGKIKYHTEDGGEDDAPYDETLSFGDGGLQLTNEPQHVTFTTLVRSSLGFKLSFYDTDDQLIMEKISTKNITASGILSFPTLEVKEPYNGHAYVDLGLSVRWATMNVGATSETEYGDYFAWGETETKTNYSEDSYTYTDNPATLPLDHDAAHVNWGGNWRMPTYAELDELKTKCTWTWTQKNGINGYEVKGPNNNTIFLPASGSYNDSSLSNVGSYGIYWSSSLYEGYSGKAYDLYLLSNDVVWDNLNRYRGRSVRPVCPKN